MIRIIPDLPKIRAHWERRTSSVPDFLMVPMSDRTVVRYVPDIKQPKPFLADKLDHFTELCIGYKKTGDCGNSQPAATEKIVHGHCTTQEGEK